MVKLHRCSRHNYEEHLQQICHPCAANLQRQVINAAAITGVDRHFYKPDKLIKLLVLFLTNSNLYYITILVKYSKYCNQMVDNIVHINTAINIVINYFATN